MRKCIISLSLAGRGDDDRLDLSHGVRAVTFGSTASVVCLGLVVDLDIQVSAVLCVGLAAQDAGDGLAFLNGEDIGQVEDGLLPVSVS